MSELERVPMKHNTPAGEVLSTTRQCLSEAVMHVVGRHQAERDVAMLGVVPGEEGPAGAAAGRTSPAPTPAPRMWKRCRAARSAPRPWRSRPLALQRPAEQPRQFAQKLSRRSDLALRRRVRA
jgi:hypothetical protein